MAKTSQELEEDAEAAYVVYAAASKAAVAVKAYDALRKL